MPVPQTPAHSKGAAQYPAPGPESKSSRPGKAATALSVAAVALAGALAYSNGLNGQFVFDDETEIVNLRLVHSLSSFFGSWDAYAAYPNRWIGYLTFALNYRLGGLDPTGYHIVNVIVHVATALLVYAFVVLAFETPVLKTSSLAPRSTVVALVSALLFVTHPVQTQAVTYIVQRLTSLATCLYLLSVVLYLRWRLGRDDMPRRTALYVGVLAGAVASMKTKEIALTLPAVILLAELAFFDGSWKRRLAWLLPVLATTAIVPIGIFGLHQPLAKVLSDASDMRLQTSLSRHDYLATELTVIATYLRLLVLPVGQHLDYAYPVARSFVEPRVAASGTLLVALLGVGGACWVRSRKGRPGDPALRLVSFGIAWFFAGQALESSIFPIADVIFEHRVYLSSIGFFVSVSAALALAVVRTVGAPAERVLVAFASVAAVALGACTLTRNAVWADELSLWSDSVSKSPAKSRSRDNLGLAYAHRGRELEAVPQFREAVRCDPRNVRAWSNLGVALVKLQRPSEAQDAFIAALGIDPAHAETLYNVGRLRLDQGRYPEAARFLSDAILSRNDYPEAFANLAVAFNQMGRYEDTIRLIEQSPGIVGGQPEAHFNLGVAYTMTGRSDAAVRQIAVLEGVAPELANRLRTFVAERMPIRPGR